MDKHFRFTNAVLLFPFFSVVLLWFVYWLQIKFDFDFYQNGIFPRTFSGLQGVFLSPFIHGDVEHLYNNSIPLLILLAALQFFYAKESVAVVVFGILMSGMITWCIGGESYHIGASGLIYVLFSFIFFKGIQTKNQRLVALSLTVIVIYGGLVWYVFPSPEIVTEKSISWEGHLGGLISGIVLSFLYDTPQLKKPIKYDWEHPDYDASQDKFMQRFDEKGNFVNLPVAVPIEQSPIYEYYTSSVPVQYELIPKKNELKL
ncbi:rhomboid family intramembrane serine protease [Flavobacterium sp. I-STPA6A]|uniref:rhomboid family intramembrane serine protease n=1 Tax=Flavobacterium sp. I-STPA6A TaxID=2590450 RepID=UPI00131D73B9|nr:rhomboid family intramembrane serine protease [Flavobacterium sp. I-STPA6A]